MTGTLLYGSSKEGQRPLFDFTLATEVNVLRNYNSKLFTAAASDLMWQNPSSSWLGFPIWRTKLPGWLTVPSLMLP
jgi:hypothetical protein